MPKSVKARYEVYDTKDGKFVICPGVHLTAADLEKILKKEFRGIPRKTIVFSTDGIDLYFGNDNIHAVRQLYGRRAR